MSVLSAYLLNFAGGKRGPKFGQVWKCHLFLLGKQNDDFVPSAAEQARLTRNGMGRLNPELLCFNVCYFVLSVLHTQFVELQSYMLVNAEWQLTAHSVYMEYVT